MQPRMKDKPICHQPIGKNMVNLLGKSYVLEILYYLFNQEKPVRFNQLKRELSITATTLSRRLEDFIETCLLYTSPSPRDAHESRMPSSA